MYWKDEFVEWSIKTFECDTARISSFPDCHFLVLGWNKNTRNERESGRDNGQWYRNGDPIDFDYLDEKTIASGSNEKELYASAEEYKKLKNMDIMDYLKSKL